MKIHFFGATKTVTGSCFLLETEDKNILIDCGIFQENSLEYLNYEPFPFNPKKLDLLIITHAHLDHSALVPKLIKEGAKCRIIATPATKDLVEIMLFDAIKVQKYENYKESLYEEEDIYKTVKRIETLQYGKPLLFNGVLIKLRDAGHILGSAFVEIEAEGKKIVFSGDIGRKGNPIIRDPEKIYDAHYLVVESTYGNRNHKTLQESVNELIEAIKDTFRRGGNVLIPAFAIGRVQDILYILNRSVKQGKLNPINVYLDSPLAEEATKIYLSHPEVFDDEALKELRNKSKSSIRLYFSKTVEESKRLNTIKSNAVIIAGSGMCQGGRILYHLIHNLYREECSIIFVGFQARGTLGRKIVDGEKELRIFDRVIPVKAKVYTIGGFSAHADQAELLEWLNSLRTEPEIFLVHGETEVIEAFKNSIEKNFGFRCNIPERLSIYELN
ncbi:MAG: MBL fold metallo-hydrolase [Thermodesulfovibrio sp.]|nr:MBL fold metallo-hydrolase [Thermodesulfovibrio sp.]